MEGKKLTENKVALLPSDYIISSFDIADALDWEHDVVLDCIGSEAEYVDGYAFKASTHNVTGKRTGFYLLDMEAVISLAREWQSYGEDENLERNLLEKFFDINRLTSDRTYDLLREGWNKMRSEDWRRDSFKDSLGRTADYIGSL